MSERKSFKGDVKEVKESGEVDAVFATLNVVDHDGDVIEKGAFGNQDAAVLFAHNSHDLVIGKAQIREVGDEAHAHIKMNMDIQRAKEVHSMLKFDLEHGEPLQEWSFGFDVMDSGQGQFEDQQVRFLKALNVHEVSPVLLGAGLNTRTTGVKEKPSVKLADQIDALIKESYVVAQRAREVWEMRQKEGRKMSAERREQLKALIAEHDRVKGVIDLLKEVEGADDEAIRIMQERIRKDSEARLPSR